MKNSLLICFITTLFCVNAYSQNLVLNPGFENINTACGGFGAGYINLVDWDNPDPTDSCSTPDWFSTCNPAGLPTHAPISWLGNQDPHGGAAYGGFIPYDASSSGYREYVEGTLQTPLTAGQSYCVSFYITRADAVPYACNRIGVYFANSFVQFPVSHCDNTVPLPYTPQLNWSGASVEDTVNWVLMSWNYTAVGGEKYFVIGNFYTNANTTTTTPGGHGGTGINPFAYYFVDDVSVTPGACCIADISPVDLMCVSDAAITLVPAVPGGTWSGTGITNTSTGVFNPGVAGAGTHIITYTLGCGSSATTSIVVDACSMTVCLEGNGNLTASNGTGPFTWESTGQVQDCSGCFLGCAFPPNCAVMTTGFVAFGGTGATTTAAPTAYPVRVTDSHNNTLTIPNAGSLSSCGVTCTLTLSTSATPATCGNATGTASIAITAGTGPYTYSWAPGGATTSSISNVAGGDYTVTVTSQGGGCTQTATVNVPESGGITLSSTSTQATCGNPNGTASVSITAGTGPFTYLWSPGGATTATASGLAAGDYTVTVSGANSCSSTTTVTVGSTNAITLSTTATPTTCGTANGTVSTSITAGTGPFTYLWSPGGATTAAVSNLASGGYAVTVTGAGGCTAIGSATVNGSTGLTVTPSTTNANCNQNNGSASVAVTGGSGSYSYSWSNGGTASAISNVATGNYDVTVNDGQGCTSTQTIYVPQNTSLTGSVTGTLVSCGSSNDGTIDLTISGGTGPYTYAWTPGGATTQDLSGLAAGTYDVTVTDNSGCQFITSYDVETENTMVVTSVVDHETCKGYHDGSIDLTVASGTGPYTYAWATIGATTQDVSGLFGGAYSVTVTDQGSGCSTTLTFNVQDGYNFPVSISQDGDTLTATSSPNYQWYYNGAIMPGETGQVLVIHQIGYYFCVVGSQNCEFSSNTIETSCICGIYENPFFEQVSVFPNPASDMLTVKVVLKDAKTAQVKLNDVAGRMVWKQENDNKASTFEWKIPVADFAQGVYFIQIIAGDEAQYIKVAIDK